MASLPTSPEPSRDPSLPAAPDAVKAALQFARETAAGEIAAIERLHARVLDSIKLQLGIIGILFSIAGWIGYEKISRVVDTTTRDLVNQKLAEALDKQNIEKEVNGLIDAKAGQQIKSEVDAQVSASVKQASEQAVKAREPELQKYTEDAARAQVQQLQPTLQKIAEAKIVSYEKEAHAQRALTEEQVNQIVEASKRVSEDIRSISWKIGVSEVNFNEIDRYALEIQRALLTGGWHSISYETNLNYPMGESYGLVIVTRDKSHPDPLALALKQCLNAANLEVTFDDRIRGSMPDKALPITHLYVMPKQP